MGEHALTSFAGTNDDLVEAAHEICRALVAGAIRSESGVTWQAEIVVGAEDDRPLLGHGDVGDTLYDGTAGIALALAACADAAPPSDAPSFAEVARLAAMRALAGGQRLLEENQVGLFDGATGVAFGVASAGRSLREGGLLESGAVLAEQVAAKAETLAGEAGQGIELDLIGGLAGTVLGLQSVADICGEPGLLRPIRAVGRAIASVATPEAWGAAWQTSVAAADGPPLLGLGHGAAGIALALGEIAAETGDDGARHACAAGLEYERGWFDAERGGWPDLRHVEDGEPTSWMTAWCHGALGIGLARIRLARITGEPLALAECSAALQAARDLVIVAGTALQTGETTDCTACHGLSGAVELLLVAAKAFSVREHARAADRVARLLLEERASADRWPCGLAGAGELPALMTGMAGIALTLLRAAGKTAVPTPLLPGAAGW